jgi:MoaA/NifB/PqqE/SkfB family radical SAM enzyme
MTVPQHNIAVLMLHPGCNMRCPFCITDEKMTAMDRDQAITLLEELRQRRADTLVLGGGEPFTGQGDVLWLARESKARGFFVQIGTNGIAMPADYARRKEVDRYVLPFESADSRHHNRMRPWKESHHSLILDRLEELREAGREVTISTVVNAENRRSLPEIAAFLSAWQAHGGQLHAWHLYRFIPAGRGGARNAGRLAIDTGAYHDAADAVRDLYPEITIFKRQDMRHSRTVDFFWFEGAWLRIGSEVWKKQEPRAPRAVSPEDAASCG